MKFFIFTTLLLAATMLPNTSNAAFCTYYRSRNTVTCGSVTCTAAVSSTARLPTGDYYIGDLYTHGTYGVPWFNLYRKRSDGNFWDYYTNIPEINCRGYFGLHAGSVSEGCITVTDYSCFNRLSQEITNNYPVIPFTVYRCRGCRPQRGCRIQTTTSRPCTADLQSRY